MTARDQDCAPSGKQMIRGEIVVSFEYIQRDVVPQAERGERVVRVKKMECVGWLILDGLLLVRWGRRQLGGAVGIGRWRRCWIAR